MRTGVVSPCRVSEVTTSRGQVRSSGLPRPGHTRAWRHQRPSRAVARGSFRARQRAGARDGVWSVSREERGDEGPPVS